MMQLLLHDFLKQGYNAMRADNSSPSRNAEISEAFWERHYAGATKPSSGRPSAALVRFAAERIPRHALDLGCARGDDVIWLARQGWAVTGVDISQTALRAARANADAVGLSDRIRFERHDLGTSFPDGRFDLVTAMFLQSPIEFGRTQALRQAAASVAPGGLLLIASHGSRVPWSSAPADIVFPTAQDELAALDLTSGNWRNVFVGEIERTGSGPNGERATVSDAIIAVERI